MIKVEHVMIASIFFILVSYKYFSLQLEENYNVYKNGSIDKKKVYHGVLIYIEKNGSIEYTNVNEDVSKLLKTKKDEENVVIPDHGPYNVHVEKVGDKTTITAIPS